MPTPARAGAGWRDRIDLNFPKFTDGRAYSQAFLLRRRLGFKGELRATGDVLVDQLQLMQRSGFDSAVLRADQSLAHGAAANLGFSPDFYQGDAVQPLPSFSHGEAPGRSSSMSAIDLNARPSADL
jgi:uncharacterized protein (DUF934 family)